MREFERNRWKENFSTLREKLREITGLQDDTDCEATVNTIQKAVEFRGTNVWILAFAIIVASVGLNVNSTAVIIGAMLISPLMGPINGLGLAIGTSDMDLLRKALKNFVLMVAISLVVSTAYFVVSPLSDAQSELLARTTPTIFDVFIAFFGGMAGIVAISRRAQSTAVISGVAIATALMPPLCTAGFGLASGQMNYFFGAFYLFFINTFFIALATVLIVRYLKFPAKEYVSDAKRVFVKRTILIFTILVLVPSIYLAVQVVRETSFNSQTIKYIAEIKKHPIFEEAELINYTKEYSRKEKTIQLSVIGKTLTEKQLETLRKPLADFGLSDVKLSVKQTSGVIEDDRRSEVLEQLLDKKDAQLKQADSIIRDLQRQLENRSLLRRDYQLLAREIAVLYPQVSTFAIANQLPVDTTKKATKKLLIEWQTAPDTTVYNQLRAWLKTRLGLEEL